MSPYFCYITKSLIICCLECLEVLLPCLCSYLFLRVFGSCATLSSFLFEKWAWCKVCYVCVGYAPHQWGYLSWKKMHAKFTLAGMLSFLSISPFVVYFCANLCSLWCWHLTQCFFSWVKISFTYFLCCFSLSILIYYTIPSPLLTPNVVYYSGHSP